MDSHMGWGEDRFRRGFGLSRRALLGAAVAATLAGCRDEAAPKVAPPTSAPRFPGDPGPGRLYLGASLSIDQPASARPDLGGERMSMARRFYQPHQIALMREATSTDVAAGILPFVSFKVPGTWLAISRGRYDRWLDQVVEGLGSLGAPVWLALHHEPENDASGPDGTREDWLAMQQRVIDRAAAAPLVTVVPVLMNWTFQARSHRNPLDWVMTDVPLLGVDIYNPWQPNGRSDWMEFADLIGMVRDVVPDQPLVIPELGTSSDPFDPTRAALWLRGAVETSLREDVVGLAWFDTETPSSRNRRLDEAGREELQSLLGRPEIARLPET